MNDFQAKYLAEVSHRLQREGFSIECIHRTSSSICTEF